MSGPVGDPLSQRTAAQEQEASAQGYLPFYGEPTAQHERQHSGQMALHLITAAHTVIHRQAGPLWLGLRGMGLPWPTPAAAPVHKQHPAQPSGCGLTVRLHSCPAAAQCTPLVQPPGQHLDTCLIAALPASLQCARRWASAGASCPVRHCAHLSRCTPGRPTPATRSSSECSAAGLMQQGLCPACGLPVLAAAQLLCACCSCGGSQHPAASSLGSAVPSKG
jgi:hypothetical protein